MDPILRRSSFYYVMGLITYMSLMGRYMLTRAWPVFEVIPLFVPVWLLGAMSASEYDERYAYLRTLPVPDRQVAKIKFRLILSFTAIQWAMMVAAALFRMSDGIAGPSTLVYVTLVCAAGLLVVACYQIAIWRYGFPPWPLSSACRSPRAWCSSSSTSRVSSTTTLAALSQSGAVEWLARAPWISSAVLVALALVAYRGLMRLGVRVKAASEAHL